MKDWQKGSGYVAEPKIKKDPWSSKDGYAQAKTIEATDPTESQTVTVKGNVSGITKVVSMTVQANPDVKVYAKPTIKDVTDPKFY